MNRELPKVYEPQQVESRVYEMWESNDCFKGKADPEKKPFSIVMPPPNVTGQLHMGHAMDATLQDLSLIHISPPPSACRRGSREGRSGRRSSGRSW